MALEYGTDEWEKAYLEEVGERMKAPQPFIAFSPEWIALYEKAVQTDDIYKEAAKDWEGSVVVHVQAAPEMGIDEDLYLFMDLWHGDCRSMRLVPKDAGEAGDFVITGSMDRWLQVARKQLDTIKGMMQGKLKLKGDLPTIVRAVKAAARLVDIIADLNTIYPDELTPEQVEDLKSWIVPLREKFGV
jgi:putative sterol carrier protein